MTRVFLLILLYASFAFSQTTVNDSLTNKSSEQWVISPTFPGGINAFTKYVESSLSLTSNCKIFVKFVIEKDGKLSNIQVVDSTDEETNKRIIDVLEKCPAWIPGSRGDKLVRTGYLYPIIINKFKD